MEINKQLQDVIPCSTAMELLNLSRTSIYRLESKNLLKPIPKRSYYLKDIQGLLLDTSWKIGAKRGRKVQIKSTLKEASKNYVQEKV